MTEETRTKTFSYGGAEFDKCSPDRTKLTESTKVLNLTLSFEEALKLNIAVDECVRKLNSYNRSTKGGKREALNLAIHLHAGRVVVTKGKL